MLRVLLLSLPLLLCGLPAASQSVRVASAAPGPAWIQRFWWLLPSRLLVEAPPAQTVTACDTLVLRGAVRAPATDVHWEPAGGRLLSLQPQARATARLRAPSVVVPTTLVLALRAEIPGRGPVTATTEIQVLPAPPLPGLAAGMAPDCAPFRHGVASGDPEPDSVVLWTRLSPGEPAGSASVSFELAEDPAFQKVVARGSRVATAAGDFTVKVDVGGLPPDRVFYYRFRASDGRYSAPGRTRTAPAGAVEHARFAVASCSSIYSGFFNAYRRIAAQPELDLVIHLGDYIYDFVDENEEIRVPTPYPVEPESLGDWRGVHAYHLNDPDLREARAMHPWYLLWDNHDVDRNAPGYNGSVQAFREWNPVRDGDPSRPDRIYRVLRWGDLVDAFLMDTLLFRSLDTEVGSTEKSILGLEQFAWIEEQLAGSTATWRLLGSQKIFSTVRVNPRLALILDGEERPVFDTGSWDGFPASRTRLLSFLASRGIGDNVMISGDSHISVAADLVDDPANPANPYDPSTGEGSVGVELLPTSISRGNFDEQIRGVGFDEAATQRLIDIILADTVARNPHHVYAELTKHGYGVLDFTRERLQAEIRYLPILERSEAEEVGVTLTAPRGLDHWQRP